MSLNLLTPPAIEPVTLAEAKSHCKVDHDVDDDMLTAMISTARTLAESRLGRSLVSQTWELRLDAFPPDAIRLARPPLISVDSIEYVDADGVTQLLDIADYTTDAHLMPGFVLPAYDFEWPATQDAANAVLVTFTCGYATVPAPIKSWILCTVGTLYGQRETFVAGQAVDVPSRFIDALLDPYTVVEFV